MYSGLDIGTTGCKIVTFNNKGEELFNVYKSYKAIHTKDGDELDYEELFNAIKYVVKETFSKYPNIKGIGVDSFGESFVLLDKNDKPLSNIIISSDARGQEELTDLVNLLGEDRIKDITGLNPGAAYSLAKILWIKKHRPEAYEKTTKILLVEDAVVYMLTGNRYIDYSLATRTMAFDINKLSWSNDILDAVGVDKDLFSLPQKLGFQCGKIKENLQKELSINTDAQIYLAGHDQVAVAIGSGIVDVNSATDGAGTVECITPVYKDLSNKKELINNNYAIVPFLNGTYVTYAFNFTSGSLIDWYAKKILGSEDKEIYRKLEEDFTLEPSNIFVLPHFSGAATPYMDPFSKGAIVGLNLSHSKSHLYQAILEGIAYEMRLNISLLDKGGIKINYLNASGGGSSSTRWLQMKADIYNAPINKVKGKECGARGGAILASVALNEFKDIYDAVKSFVKIEQTFYPDDNRHKLYLNAFKKYQKLYQLSKEVMKNE